MRMKSQAQQALQERLITRGSKLKDLALPVKVPSVLHPTCTALQEDPDDGAQLPTNPTRRRG